MKEPTQEQKIGFWEYVLNTHIEERGGYWDECGNFCEMQSNPYSLHESHHIKELCYLVESRDLTQEELAEYQQGFDKGIAKWMPTKAELWEAIPELDLNNLFRYSPLDCKADLHIEFHEVHWTDGKVFTECVITKDFDEIGRGLVEGKLKDVANYALFWAIWEVIKDGETHT